VRREKYANSVDQFLISKKLLEICKKLPLLLLMPARVIVF